MPLLIRCDIFLLAVVEWALKDVVYSRLCILARCFLFWVNIEAISLNQYKV